MIGIIFFLRSSSRVFFTAKYVSDMVFPLRIFPKSATVESQLPGNRRYNCSLIRCKSSPLPVLLGVLLSSFIPKMAILTPSRLGSPSERECILIDLPRLSGLKSSSKLETKESFMGVKNSRFIYFLKYLQDRDFLFLFHSFPLRRFLFD